jgi:hypothetical protein
VNRSLEALEPGVRQFVETVCSESARLTAGRALDWAHKRPIAEATRAPWRSGGPAMADTREETLPGNGTPFRVRLYYPRVSDQALPVLVYLHGGGWSIFSIDTHDRLMREYAQATGAVVVGVDYALSPEHRYPVALSQCVETVRWLRANASELRLDTSRVALGGDSARCDVSLAIGRSGTMLATAETISIAEVISSASLSGRGSAKSDRPKLSSARTVSAGKSRRWRSSEREVGGKSANIARHSSCVSCAAAITGAATDGSSSANSRTSAAGGLAKARLRALAARARIGTRDRIARNCSIAFASGAARPRPIRSVS